MRNFAELQDWAQPACWRCGDGKRKTILNSPCRARDCFANWIPLPKESEEPTESARPHFGASRLSLGVPPWAPTISGHQHPGGWLGCPWHAFSLSAAEWCTTLPKAWFCLDYAERCSGQALPQAPRCRCSTCSPFSQCPHCYSEKHQSNEESNQKQNFSLMLWNEIVI